MRKFAFVLMLLTLLVGCEDDIGVRYDYYTVETGEAINVTETTAELKGQMFPNNVPDANSLHYGVMYSEQPKVVEAHARASEAKKADDLGKYVATISGLAAGKTYYYRAFVLYRSKYYYGDVRTFETENKDTDQMENE